MQQWCPWCHYRAARGFTRGRGRRCPQCGKPIEDGEALTTDPYKPSKKGTRQEKENPKKFVFDQLDSGIKSIPTETLGFIKKEK